MKTSSLILAGICISFTLAANGTALASGKSKTVKPVTGTAAANGSAVNKVPPSHNQGILHLPGY